MRILYFLALIFGLVACSPEIAHSQKRKKKKDKDVIIDPRPEWVKRKPVEMQSYLGVGSASKIVNDYQQAAKKSALQDLISEVKVTVASSSVLSQIDKNNTFKEEYESKIKTTAADDIEGYDIVDAYEDANVYWVFYRLSKAKYAEIKRKKLENAKKTATEFYLKALIFEADHDIVSAIDFYFKAFYAVKDYWGESVEVEIDGKTLKIATEAYTKVQQILDNLSIKAPESIQVSRKSVAKLVLTAKVLDPESLPIAKFPLQVAFLTAKNKNTESFTTNEKGETTIGLDKNARLMTQIRFSADLHKIFNGNLEDKYYNFALQSLRVPTQSVQVKVPKPTLYITSSEKNLTKDVGIFQMKERLKNLLSTKGYTFTETKQKADFQLDILADTRQGTATESIFVAYLDLNIKGTDTQSRDEVFNYTNTNTKGFQLSYERAGLDAYKKAYDLLEKQVLKQLEESLF